MGIGLAFHMSVFARIPDAQVPLFVAIGESRFGKRFAVTKGIESFG